MTSHAQTPAPPGAHRLPAPAVEAASAWWRAGRKLLGDETEPVDVIADLTLPLVVEPEWAAPRPPVAAGDGWVQADLSPDDLETFATLRSTLPADAGPERLARAAQEWRLPVLPYRSTTWSKRGSESGPTDDAADPGGSEGVPVSVEGVKVLDLTAMWAGPLATQMLARAGAKVTKVDPSCRPDGFRAWPRLFDALNSEKDMVDLDLRVEQDRESFEWLVADADLLVSSFSRRVLPNLGYGAAQLRSLNPGLATLAIVGFPLGCPEQDWLAFGTGIHAVSGFGIINGSPVPAAVGYPDAVAGYAAFATAIALLRRGGEAEVSLISALMSPPGSPAGGDMSRRDIGR